MGIVERYKERVKQRLRDYAIVEAYRKRRQMRLDYNDSQPREKNGQFGEVPDSEQAENKEKREEEQKNGETEKHPQEGMQITPRGANPSCVGFANRYLEDEHYGIHAQHEPIFEGMSKEEYAKAVDDFLQQPTSPKIWGYTFKADLWGHEVTGVVRFDTTTGFFAKGYPGMKIATGMQAKYLKDSRDPSKGINKNWLPLAMQYYKDKLEEDKGDDGRVKKSGGSGGKGGKKKK